MGSNGRRMTTTRWLIRAALLLTLLFGAQARFLNHLPGDVAVARAVQAEREADRLRVATTQHPNGSDQAASL